MLPNFLFPLWGVYIQFKGILPLKEKHQGKGKDRPKHGLLRLERMKTEIND